MESEFAERLKTFSITSEEKNEVSLEDEDIAKSRAECERSLVGKIYGSKKVNFSGLKNTTSSIWHTKEAFSAREIGYNLFQFVFLSQEDKIRVLNGKIWSFDNQYLILRKWSDDILGKMEEINSVELWVQIWNLPCHWVGIETGKKNGRKFENISDVFVPETGSSRGRYVKILVEVKLDKPLLRGTNVKLGTETVWVDFRYENLQNFCFYCGFVGHVEKRCNKRKEDLKSDKLLEGQFGEWLRVLDVKVGKQIHRQWRQSSPVETTNLHSNLEKNEEVDPQGNLVRAGDKKEMDAEKEHGEENDHMNYPQDRQSQEFTINENSSIIQEKNMGPCFTDKTGTILSFPEREQNKENLMQIDCLELKKDVVQREGKRGPLREIQNSTIQKVYQPGKASKGDRESGKRGKMESFTSTPMDISFTDISFTEEPQKYGQKRSLELIDDQDEIPLRESKKARILSWDDLVQLKEVKVEVASLK